MKEQRTKQILICLAASLGCFWLGNRAGLLYVSAAGTVTQGKHQGIHQQSHADEQRLDAGAADFLRLMSKNQSKKER